ncbi:TIGR03643 family protein [Raineya sp.]|jgi:uncharacterized protein (TIGR03643 family)
MKTNPKYNLSPAEIDRIVEMAWEDRTPFEAIEAQFGLKEQEVIGLMRSEMKKSSWKHWRKRMNSRKTKHLQKRIEQLGRFRCSRQKAISHNKIT